MSGDIIEIGGDETLTHLVEVAAQLTTTGFSELALVGGLAVVCRLATAHRATEDLDTVVGEASPSAIEVIVAAIAGAEPQQTRVRIEGVKVDVIETYDLEQTDFQGIDVSDRLFMQSHRWALESAVPATIKIAGSSVQATLPVAVPEALVAMKTGAVGRRTGAKRATDLYDLYRLLEAHDRQGAIAERLAAAPRELGVLVGTHLTQLVVDQPEQAIQWLSPGGPVMRGVRPHDLTDVVGPLCERLTRDAT